MAQGQRRQHFDDRDRDREEFDERVVDIARTAKVLKGGRRFAFRVVVVIGDNQGSVGVGVGKAREVPEAVRKGIERAKRNMRPIPIVGGTIPHEIMARHGAATVFLRPASPGTGVIAGGGVRAVLEVAGIKDILTKSLGSNNILNVVYATMEGLKQLKDLEEEAQRRGKLAGDIRPFWSRREYAEN
jgi:small subunit ribosomal protein S5